MCGICGFLGEGGQETLDRMVAALRHRGPDDRGTHREAGLGLGCTRLAILDLSAAGHQPMPNRERTVWIAYNGETYNFRAERQILEQRGRRFSSSSDTEVVLGMYEEYGDDFLSRLRAMFALALYDRRRGPGRERLLLARDPFGIKPLLFAYVGPRLVFASEIKTLLASRLLRPEIDPEALRQLLTYGAVRQPRTILRGVSMLPPGHYLVVEGGTSRLQCYWRPETGRRPALREISAEARRDVLGELLDESTRLQMVSDVPLGAFLSGGIDSTLLVASCRLGSRPPSPFGVGNPTEPSL
jgi:asparagine synthase (glutamine-hydrolysing)